jgi:hypothetical protein
LPRRKSAEAQAATRRAVAARWRYTIRNPRFREEIEALHVLKAPARSDEFHAECHRVSRAWRAPITAVYVWAEWGWPDDIAELDAFADNPVLFDLPVALKYESLPDDSGNNLPVGPARVLLRDGHVVELHVDLNFPVDDLLPLIEKELRALARGLRRPKRRPDRADLQLRVFDLAASDLQFSRIARKLGEPESTVKSAFLSARRHVYGADAPSKRDLPLRTSAAAGFDPATHVPKCARCRNAKTVETMCTLAKAYARLRPGE